MVESLYETHFSWLMKRFGGEPMFKTREEKEQFDLTFRLGCLISLNSGPEATRIGTLPAGRYTQEIVSLYHTIKRCYPEYILSEDSRKELEPFLVGPFENALVL